MSDDLVGAHLKRREFGKGGLQGTDEFGLELGIQLVAGVVALDVAADVDVEQNGVGDLVGINTRATDGHVHVKSDAGVDHAEGNGVGRAELVVDKLLGVEVVDALILARVATVGKAAAEGLEGFNDALAK